MGCHIEQHIDVSYIDFTSPNASKTVFNSTIEVCMVAGFWSRLRLFDLTKVSHIHQTKPKFGCDIVSMSKYITLHLDNCEAETSFLIPLADEGRVVPA